MRRHRPRNARQNPRTRRAIPRSAVSQLSVSNAARPQVAESEAVRCPHSCCLRHQPPQQPQEACAQQSQPLAAIWKHSRADYSKAVCALHTGAKTTVLLNSLLFFNSVGARTSNLAPLFRCRRLFVVSRCCQSCLFLQHSWPCWHVVVVGLQGNRSSRSVAEMLLHLSPVNKRKRPATEERPAKRARITHCEMTVLGVRSENQEVVQMQPLPAELCDAQPMSIVSDVDSMLTVVRPRRSTRIAGRSSRVQAVAPRPAAALELTAVDQSNMYSAPLVAGHGAGAGSAPEVVKPLFSSPPKAVTRCCY